MERMLILLSMVLICSASFFPVHTSEDDDALNVCVFSNDPTKYTPNCFVCPKKVYTFALQACVNGTTMPSNITYDSAHCIEKNCQINYPTPKPSPIVAEKGNFFEFLGKLLSGKNVYKRSVEDNKIAKAVNGAVSEIVFPKSDWNIIGHVETFASDQLLELDYDT